MPERSGRPLQAPHDVAGTALSLDGQAGRRFHSGGGTASGINVSLLQNSDARVPVDRPREATRTENGGFVPATYGI